MKIAYIMPVSTSLTGKSHGVRMQAMIWRDALVKRGHQVDLIETWGGIIGHHTMRYTSLGQALGFA